MSRKLEIDSHYIHRTTLFSMYGSDGGCVVFLGDSITEMCEWQEFFPEIRIINRGISGDSTAGVLNRLDQIIGLNPEKIFLTIGVNDLQRHYPMDEVISNIREIILKLSGSTGAIIFLQSILPVREMMLQTGIKNSTIDEVNASLAVMARELNIQFLDNNALLKDISGNLSLDFTSDGLHLNGYAYSRWAMNIKEKVIG